MTGKEDEARFRHAITPPELSWLRAVVGVGWVSAVLPARAFSLNRIAPSDPGISGWRMVVILGVGKTCFKKKSDPWVNFSPPHSVVLWIFANWMFQC